jgi:DNA-binding winged helix-turn-helix (wHTH) protein
MVAGPKMYELLEVLIKRRPAVVTNNELDELLWPKVYVERTSLTRLISELRAVLGDTPRDSHIIRTAYKPGYAFCANVTCMPSAGAVLEGVRFSPRARVAARVSRERSFRTSAAWFSIGAPAEGASRTP